MKPMKKLFFPTERGQALILITFAAIGLFAMAGLAIDGTAKFSDRRHAQNAADTAALAGSLSLVNGKTTVVYGNVREWQYDALQRADSNGYDRNLVSNRIWVYRCADSKTDSASLRYQSPVDCGPYEGQTDYVQVVIESNINTYFARVIGINQTHNVVSALAISQRSYTSQLYGGASIVGLAPDQCKTIYFSGSAAVNVTGGSIFSNSNLDCGFYLQGAHGLSIGVDGSVNMVASGYSTPGNPSVSGITNGIHGGGSAYDYPPPDYMLPTYTCDYTYANFPPDGVTKLSPGTYCVTDKFKMTGGTLTGTGVTIVMQSGSIDWSGNTELNLSAPTSGDLAGMLIYSPMSNTNTMKFNGTADTDLTGTIFMPAAPLEYNGTGNVNPSHVQIIGYTINLGGSNDTNVIYDNPSNWDDSVPAQVGIMQ